MKKFTLDPERAALVIIDMQKFSCAADTEERRKAIDRLVLQINRLAHSCRNRNIPVIWVRHNIQSKDGENDGGFFDLFHDKQRMSAVMDQGPGTDLFSGMDVDSARDHIVFKNRYSAFLASPPELQNKLQELERTQLLITGIAANVCVESTLRDAMQLDYEVMLVSDGTLGTDEIAYQNTLSNTEQFFGDVVSTQALVRAMS